MALGTGGPGEVVDRARARLGVGAPAALALVVLAGAAALWWGVSAARGAPGVPVPARTAVAGAEHATAAPGPGDSVPAAGAAGGPSDVPAGPSTAGPGAVGAAPGPSTAAGEVVVHVVGRVDAPGVVRLLAGSRVADAIEAAGGPAGEADLARVNLARVLVDGEQVVVPAPGEELPAPVAAPPAAGGAASTPGGSGSAPVDLRTAGVAELDALPGIGPVLSQRIVEHRETIGGFRSVDELGEVSGIGDVLLERLRPLVSVG